MSSNDLPREILIDILERLPIKGLIICSSVSKSWYKLITNPGFIASHLNQAKFRSNGYLLHMTSGLGDPPSCHAICDSTLAEQFNLAFPFDCESFNVTVSGSCNGILCITDDDGSYFGRIVYLWNPSIRKLKSVPRSSHATPQFFHLLTWVVLGLGFDKVSGDHKIVKFSYFWDHKEKYTKTIPNETEVYTLRTNSWRRIEAIVSCKAQRSSMAFVNGSAHWIARKPKGPDYHLILSFDFSNEVFQEMMLPANCYKGIRIHSEVLSGIHGSLSLLINSSPDDGGMFYCCYMWVMKEYGVADSRVKHFKFVAREGIDSVPGLTTNGDIIYQNHKMEYFLCDPMHGRHENTGIGGSGFQLVAFTESLVLLDEH